MLTISIGACAQLVNMQAGSTPPPTSSASIEVLADGTFEVQSDAETVNITISDPAVYAGNYVVTQAALQSGPVNLLTPDIATEVRVGQVTDRTPGLWAYDTNGSEPIVSLQWFRNGAPIAGATMPEYIPQFSDTGQALSVQETATQNGAGNTTVMSQSVPVTAYIGENTVVVSLIGQSNMVGFAPFDDGTDYPAGVLQLDRSGTLVPAAYHLDHHEGDTNWMGLALTFATEYMNANPTHTLVLVPDAKGATGFVDNHWNPNDFYYSTAVSRLNTLLAANPTAQLGGFLWHQGEADTSSIAAANSHAGRLDTMINALRQDVTGASAETPFVLGGMVPSWVAELPVRQIVETGLTETPGRIDETAFVSAEGLHPLPDGIHFSAASYREFGSRYFAAYDNLNNWNLSQTQIIAAPSVSAPIASGSTVT